MPGIEFTVLYACELAVDRTGTLVSGTDVVRIYCVRYPAIGGWGYTCFGADVDSGAIVYRDRPGWILDSAVAGRVREVRVWAWARLINHI